MPTTPLKILCWMASSFKFRNGGGEISSYEIVKRLSLVPNIKVFSLSVDRSGKVQSEEEFTSEGVTSYILPYPRRQPLNVARFREIVSTVSPDIIFGQVELFPDLVTRDFTIPSVLILRSSFQLTDFAKRPFATNIVANSNYIKLSAEKLGFNVKAVASPYVDPNFFSHIPPTQNRYDVLVVSPDEHKGGLWALEFARANPTVTLAYCGRSPSSYKSRPQNLVSLGKVALEEMPATYRAAKVVYGFPRCESYGRWMVEAALCGVPYVTSTAEGCPEVSIPEAAFASPQASFSRLLSLLSSPDLRQEQVRHQSQHLSAVVLPRQDLQMSGLIQLLLSFGDCKDSSLSKPPCP